MWVISIMQIDLPMTASDIMSKTSTYHCLISFTSIDGPNREWIIKFFDVVIVHEKSPGGVLFVVEVEDILLYVIYLSQTKRCKLRVQDKYELSIKKVLFFNFCFTFDIVRVWTFCE